MWYGYVGPRLNGVTRDFSVIENVVKKIPYATYRAFRQEEDAWKFIASRKSNYIIFGITRYGDIFSDLYMKVEYFIKSKGVYANLDTSKLGYIRLGNVPKDIDIEYKAQLIKVFIPIEGLSQMSIYSNATAIESIIDVIGDLVDIEITIPNFSIFYMLTQYTGNKFAYTRLLNKIKSRSGNVAYTISRRHYGDETSEYE